MKKNKIRKSMIIIAVIIMALPIGASAASATLNADYATAKATLSCDFHWKIFADDSATASTEMTYVDPEAPEKYRVAVRLEAWENRKKCTKFTYKSGNETASTSLTANDVYQFASRHSIDNSNNTKELEATSFYNAEL